MKSQDAYTMHKRLRRKFRRNKFNVINIDDVWLSDLKDLSNISAHNYNYKFILVVMDMFSRYAKVIPLYKAKDRQLLTNYRPISILPSLSKVLERAVHHKLMRFLNHNGLLYESQYEFRKHHNTIHGVTELVHNIIHGYVKGEMTIGVMADLSKAFDTIEL